MRWRSLVGLRPCRIRLKPCAASSWLKARPMPSVEPVIRAQGGWE